MKRHFFICPDCGEPTRELVDRLRCFDCSEILRQGEDAEGQVLVHRASQDGGQNVFANLA